jgi:hypothetical protein
MESKTYECPCGKTYNYPQNLYAHRKNCKAYLQTKTNFETKPILETKTYVSQGTQTDTIQKNYITMNNIKINTTVNLGEKFYTELLLKFNMMFESSAFEYRVFNHFYKYINSDDYEYIIDIADICEFIDSTVIINFLKQNFFNSVHYIYKNDTYFITIFTLKRLLLSINLPIAVEIFRVYDLMEYVVKNTIYSMAHRYNYIRDIENDILSRFEKHEQCVYYGTIDDTTETGEKLIKFGMSNLLKNRVESHRKTYNNFILVAAFKVNNNAKIEYLIKKHPLLRNLRRCITIDGKNKTELLCINDLSLSRLNEIIEEIINTE